MMIPAWIQNITMGSLGLKTVGEVCGASVGVHKNQLLSDQRRGRKDVPRIDWEKALLVPPSVEANEVAAMSNFLSSHSLACIG